MIPTAEKVKTTDSCEDCEASFTVYRRNGIQTTKKCPICYKRVKTENRLTSSKDRLNTSKKPIKKVSAKQEEKNKELARIKKTLPKICIICGGYGNQLAHLLPKSCYPQYYIFPENLVIMDGECHDKYDNNIEFRKRRTRLYNRVASFDKQSANKYFQFNK